MAYKGPHISTTPEYLVQRILRIPLNEVRAWPETVRFLAIRIAEELFLVCYNPFIDSDIVRNSVAARWEFEKPGLAHHYATSITEGITMFWSAFEAEIFFTKELLTKLPLVLAKENIDVNPNSLVQASTDATDLRMELPLAVITPSSIEEVSAVVKLANEMKFALIPRGGGSGLTGGAVPARKRSVVLSLTKLCKIKDISVEEQKLCTEAGVITSDCIKAVADKKMLFTIDPASKTASSIGGNVSENAGGPLAFEYGTTIDNLLSWRMVAPNGNIIDIIRKNHPRRKILENDLVEFEILDSNGQIIKTICLKGSEIRKPGLGKDVSNKALGGLPGVQKEGVDGVIVEACFVLHAKLKYSKVMVLEFYGRSMHFAVEAIRDIVAFREKIRQEGDNVKISALEEFNSKYVQAIEYKKKSETFEGMPISVLIVQLDSNDASSLDKAVQDISTLVLARENVDAFVAKDEKEAELFWEDRHKLSAIAKRTSGFKINEDVVIPLEAVPEYAKFLEQINLECAAKGYRESLQAVGRLPNMAFEDKDFNREFSFASKVARGVEQGGLSVDEMNDDEFMLHVALYFEELRAIYPVLAEKIQEIENHLKATRIVVGSHMHAGDGNCHVNIPVNSNDPVMLENAEIIANKVMAKAQEIGGEVSGEHGIGITKIKFLSSEKMQALIKHKAEVDPGDVFNPGKLVQHELPVAPFTFSFNKLIQDLRDSGVADKERLISILTNIQICTRCGKCKQYCPMFYPEGGLRCHPRNKNIFFGAMLEAIYYTQVNKGKPSKNLLEELRRLVEHCNGCGKCTAACPVKIPSGVVGLELLSFLKYEGAGGHPVKSKALSILAKNVPTRVPWAAKVASVGQKVQNKLLPIVPNSIRSGFANPMFQEPGPEIGSANLYELLHLDRGPIFVPKSFVESKDADTIKEAVFYFPGCGGSLFYRNIGLAAIWLLLKAGVAVVVPPNHLCCGVPILVSGDIELFNKNKENTKKSMQELIKKVEESGLKITSFITSCGSCRGNFEEFYELNNLVLDIKMFDVTQFIYPRINLSQEAVNTDDLAIYHSACHTEWSGVSSIKAPEQYMAALEKFASVSLLYSSSCCAESGMGAITTPLIYNKLRIRKTKKLEKLLEEVPSNIPVLIGCPSCKVGIKRILMKLKDKRSVLHTLEYLAGHIDGYNWKKQAKKIIASSHGKKLWRIIDI